MMSTKRTAGIDGDNDMNTNRPTATIKGSTNNFRVKLP